MAKGIFPQMSIPDITNALAGWGLSVSHEQLVRPSPDFVEAVYCACLQQVTDIDHDSLRDPVQSALTASTIEDKVRDTIHHRPFFVHHLLGYIYLCVDQ
jgi:kinetochore protein Nuf2